MWYNIFKEIFTGKQPNIYSCIKIGEDAEFMTKAFACAAAVYYDSRLCFIYQMRSDSVMGRYRNHLNDLDNAFRLKRKTVHDCVEKYPDLKRDSICYVVYNYLRQIYYHLKI